MDSILSNQSVAPRGLDGPHRLLLEAWRFTHLRPKELGLARLIAGLKGQWITRSSGDEERRRLGRRACRHKVVCEGANRSFDAVVLDIALGGLRIQTSSEPRLGGRLKVGSSELPGDEVVCRVAWWGQGQAGLAFEAGPDDLAASWVTTLLSETGFDESVIFRSKDVLRKAPLPVRLRSRHLDCEARCLDLGPGGAEFECYEEIAKATELEVFLGPYADLGPLKLPGVVVHLAANANSGSHIHTLCFEPDEEGQEELLTHYIAALLGPVPEFLGL